MKSPGRLALALVLVVVLVMDENLAVVAVLLAVANATLWSMRDDNMVMAS